MLIRHRLFQVMAALIVLLGFAFGPTGAQPAAAAPANVTVCYAISPTYNGLRLDVEGGSTANGARIIQWYLNSAQNQKFKFWRTATMPSDVYFIESVSSGLVLEIATLSAGAQVIQHSNYYGTNQQWQEIHTSNGNKYRNVATGLYLDVTGYSYAAGTGLDVWYQTNGGNQEFQVFNVGC